MPDTDINDLPTIVDYEAAPGQTHFTFPFRLFDTDYLSVTVSGEDCAYTISPATDRQFSIDTDLSTEGGAIDFGVGMAGGETVVLERILPAERLTRFPDAGPVPMSSVNAEFDRLIALIQQVKNALGLGVAPADRADKILGFGSLVTGALVELYDIATFKGDPGGNAMAIGLFTAAAALTIPSGTDLVQTSGYGAVGSGAARYSYDATVDAAYVVANPRTSFVSANSRGFKLNEFAPSLTMFGAVNAGIGSIAAGTGPSSTDAVNAALAWGFANARAIWADAGYFYVGNVTTYPATILIGQGKFATSFIAEDGATGAWWTDNGSGSKLWIEGCGFYGRDLATLTEMLNFGNGGIEFGTEGKLSDLYLANLKNGTGLKLRGNAAVIENITILSCLTNFDINGSGHSYGLLVSMQAGLGATAPLTSRAMNLRDSWYIDNLHVEAPATGTIPVKMRGNCYINNAVFSLAAGFSHDAAFEIDVTGHFDWAVNQIKFVSTGTLLQGVYCERTYDGAGAVLTTVFYGGTDRVDASGSSNMKQITLRGTGTGGTGRVLSVRSGTAGGSEKASIRDNGDVYGANFYSAGVKVVGNRGAAVADAAAPTYAAPAVTYSVTYAAPVGGATQDTEARASLAQLAGDVAELAADLVAVRAALAAAANDYAAGRTALNTSLARDRAHGLIAP